MPNEIHWEDEGFVHHFRGVLSGSELLRATEAAHADPRFDDAKYAIADFTACTGLVVTEEETAVLTAIAGAAARNRRSMRTRSAFVVTDPRLVAQFTGFVQNRLAPPGTRIFSTLDEAKNWALSAR